MLSYYTDSTFCILLQLHVYDKITDMGTDDSAPMPVIHFTSFSSPSEVFFWPSSPP